MYCSRKCKKKAQNLRAAARKRQGLPPRPCDVCGGPVKGHGKRKYCSDECRRAASRAVYRLTGPRGYTSPCTDCGKPVSNRFRKAEVTCNPCRRKRPGYKPQPPPGRTWQPQLVTCPCGEVFEQHRYGQKYCHPDHRPNEWSNRTPSGTFRPRTAKSAAARGYGTAHQKRRRQALAAFVPGMLCQRCGDEMDLSQDLDLDHTDDKSGYLGLSHRACNRRMGAINANRSRGRLG